MKGSCRLCVVAQLYQEAVVINRNPGVCGRQALELKVTLTDLASIPVGRKRRNTHDDITVVVVMLKVRDVQFIYREK